MQDLLDSFFTPSKARKEQRLSGRKIRLEQWMLDCSSQETKPRILDVRDHLQQIAKRIIDRERGLVPVVWGIG
jgi:hypothetical protein